MRRRELYNGITELKKRSAWKLLRMKGFLKERDVFREKKEVMQSLPRTIYI